MVVGGVLGKAAGGLSKIPIVAKMLAGGTAFGTYGGVDKATNIASGLEQSDSPVIDTMKATGRDFAIGILPRHPGFDIISFGR